MSPASFSNNGIDTFNPRNRYVGVRLQQGVPLLDRDWNELEDIRRYFERRTRDLNIGAGVPDATGFAIRAVAPPAAGDVVVSAGSCSIAGLDVSNDADVVFSKQGELKALPLPAAAGDTLVVYLEASVARIDELTEPNLINKDIGVVTCVRDQLRWAVKAVVAPQPPPAAAYVLAEIRRPAGQATITDDMITDRRRTRLNLADAIDRLTALEKRVADLTLEVRGVPSAFDVARFDRPYVFA